MAGPVTLTQPQFQKLRPNGNYQSYLQFVANRRGVPVSSLTPAAGGGSSTGATDPASALANLLGYTPQTAAQIQTQAQSEIAPIIAAATSQANTQAGQQASQINALTQDYANELGQINMATPYQSAEGQQAAVDSALQQSLTGQGSDLASGLADRLKALQGSSGAGALQQAANQLSSQGQSSGNTQLASGSAALSNLIANAAAGTAFGQKMPLVADLAGTQALGESAGQQQQDINNAVLQAETQLPSIVQNLTANQQSALANAVTADQKQQALDIDQAVKNATLGIQQENANTSAGRAASTAAYQHGELQQKAAAATRPNATLSKLRGYLVDSNGTPILGKNGQVQPVKTSTSKAGSLTANEAEKLMDTYYNGVAPKTYQGQPVAGTGAPPITYGKAVQKLVALGYPKAKAVALANSYYQPGEGGRPNPGNSKKAVTTAKQVGAALFPDPTAIFTGG